MGSGNASVPPLSQGPVRKKSELATLVQGIIVGFGFTYFVLYSNFEALTTKPNIFEIWMSQSPYSRHHADEGDDSSHSNGAWKHTVGPIGVASFHSPDEAAHTGEDFVAQQLAKKVRVLCWIMTSPSNREKKAKYVKATWGKRCNKLIFMSSQNDTDLGAIGLPNVAEGRNWLWAKTKEAFKYVWKHHKDEADWFMKADDDTFVIVENLRLMLREYDSEYPIYFGCRLKDLNRNYMNGGVGYVLSKEAVKRFVEEAIPNPKKCSKGHRGAEDMEIAKCLQNVGVEAGDSRDRIGRHRFMSYLPENYMIPTAVKETRWFPKDFYYPFKPGMNCCSDYIISFHAVGPNQFFVLEYLIYHLRPYGISYHTRAVVEEKPKT